MQDVLGALCAVGEKWISDLVWEYPQITVNLETVSNFQGWACDLATLSQVLYVIFNDINNTEEGRMVLDLFGGFKFFLETVSKHFIWNTSYFYENVLFPVQILNSGMILWSAVFSDRMEWIPRLLNCSA